MVGNQQSLNLRLSDPDGVYTVTLIGCNAAPVSYNYQKQNLTQSYTIIALEDVELGELNHVQSGSVGSTDPSGKVKIGKKSTIASPGFAKARKLEIHPTAVVPLQYAGAPVMVTLPTMQPNTTTPAGSNISVSTNSTIAGNYKDVIVKKNVIVTFTTGTIFKKLTLEEGARATFNSSVVNFEEIEIKSGKAIGSGNRTRLNFGGNTSVRVEKKVEVGDNCRINEAGHKVTFYVEDENFQVQGKGTRIVANVFAPKGDITVDGHGSQFCYMTGQFIAKKVKSEGKNVIWNAYDCNEDNSIPPSLITTQIPDMNETGSRLQVRLFPNPSEDIFNLAAITSSKEEMHITMYNMVGLKVEQIKVMPGQMMRLGGNIVSGTYLIEVRQGNEKVTLKVVKQ